MSGKLVFTCHGPAVINAVSETSHPNRVKDKEYLSIYVTAKDCLLEHYSI